MAECSSDNAGGVSCAAVGRETSEPVAPSRAAKQRARILNAAELCFIQSGFHAASMGEIAKTANISAGLIYRYFNSKSEIVKAIIEGQLDSKYFRKIEQLSSAEDMSRSILETFDSWQRRDDPKLNPLLMLELTTESTRDDGIARAVRVKDRALGSSITAAVRRAALVRGARLMPAAARSRAVMLQCLVEGLAMRVVRDPKLSRATLKPALDAIVTVLMS
jgi:AcrR family transcriptional regulator